MGLELNDVWSYKNKYKVPKYSKNQATKHMKQKWLITRITNKLSYDMATSANKLYMLNQQHSKVKLNQFQNAINKLY